MEGWGNFLMAIQNVGNLVPKLLKKFCSLKKKTRALKNLPSSSVKSVNFASEFVVTSCTQIFPFEKYAIKSGFVGDIIGLALVMLLG